MKVLTSTSTSTDQKVAAERKSLSGPPPVPDNCDFLKLKFYHRRGFTMEQIIASRVEREILPFVELFCELKKNNVDDFAKRELVVIDYEYETTKYSWIREELSHGDFLTYEEWWRDTVLSHRSRWMAYAQSLGPQWFTKISEAYDVL